MAREDPSKLEIRTDAARLILWVIDNNTESPSPFGANMTKSKRAMKYAIDKNYLHKSAAESLAYSVTPDGKKFAYTLKKKLHLKNTNSLSI